MGTIKYEFSFTICLIFYLLNTKWGKLAVPSRPGMISMQYLQWRSVNFLISLDQPSLNFKTTFALRENGKYYF
jgi:hypothetical protein